MKGWLDNYNDRKMSVPKGFVGMGNLTKGRNYSPAWGGQFKSGGELKKLQPGGMLFVPPQHQEKVARETLHQVGEAYKPIEDVIFAPQKKATEMFSGKYEYPSHAMGIHNPWLGLAADLVLDPMNLAFGAGLLNKSARIKKFIDTAGSMQKMDRTIDTVRGTKEAVDSLTKGYAAVNTMVPIKNVGVDMETKYVENLLPNKFATPELTRTMLPMMEDLNKRAFERGGVIKDPMGQWAHPGEITEIPSNNITMRGVNYPVIGISDKGDTKLMKPGKNYKFKGKKVTEYPLAKNGTELTKLDQLTNFTNYNKPTRGGWLDKYK